MFSIELRPFNSERDEALIKAWLQCNHVARWWSPASDALREIQAHNEHNAAIICLNSQPVGFVCWQTPSPKELLDAGLSELPLDLIDVDIMIGDPCALGRGVGPAALHQLFETLRALGFKHVGMATSTANIRALAACAKVGLAPFHDFIEHGELYRYLTKALNAAA